MAPHALDLSSPLVAGILGLTAVRRWTPGRLPGTPTKEASQLPVLPPHRSQTAERVTPFTLSKEAKGLAAPWIRHGWWKNAVFTVKPVGSQPQKWWNYGISPLCANKIPIKQSTNMRNGRHNMIWLGTIRALICKNWWFKDDQAWLKLLSTSPQLTCTWVQ